MRTTVRRAERPPPRLTRLPAWAFTLIEMLVVIAIIGILAAIAVPAMNSFKPNVTAAASQQLMADIGRARQLAISERTTVYMVFVPTNYYDPSGPYGRLSVEEQRKADRLLDKQRVGYNYVTLRSLGDQPGTPTPRYLSSWKTLPEGVFIPEFKFNPRTAQPAMIQNQVTRQVYYIAGFARTNNIPFPSEQAAWDANRNRVTEFVEMPYLAFNHLGQLVSESSYEIIPLARGSVLFGRDAKRQALKRAPSLEENPPGNSTNSSFNLIYIDGLTGRARVERQEIK